MVTAACCSKRVHRRRTVTPPAWTVIVLATSKSQLSFFDKLLVDESDNNLTVLLAGKFATYGLAILCHYTSFSYCNKSHSFKLTARTLLLITSYLAEL